MKQFTVLFAEHDEPKNVLTSHVEAKDPHKAFDLAAQDHFKDVYEGWESSFSIQDYTLIAVFSGHIENLK